MHSNSQEEYQSDDGRLIKVLKRKLYTTCQCCSFHMILLDDHMYIFVIRYLSICVLMEINRVHWN